jgi:hypothetical protein
MSSSNIASRLATTGRLLVRSGIEIGRILDSMLEDGDTVSASLPAQMILLSKLMRVEPANGTMLLAYSENKKANVAALAARSLVLRCNHRGAQFAFAGDKPRYAVDEGEPCIRCGLPATVPGMQQRRGRDGIQAPAPGWRARAFGMSRPSPSRSTWKCATPLESRSPTEGWRAGSIASCSPRAKCWKT